MIDRLHRVLTLIEQLSPQMQDEVAEQLEDWVAPLQNSSISYPQSLAGAWEHLSDADEMIDELDRLRHKSVPTPALEDQDF